MNQQAVIERNDAGIPSDYGNPLEEYDAIDSSAGVIRLPYASVLSLGGKNAEQFLNGLVSNDVKSLETGQGTLAAFLDVAGKVQALSRIYKSKVDDSAEFLLELESINTEKILRNLSRFVLAGGFSIENLSDSLSVISIQGRKSSIIAAEASGEDVPLENYGHKKAAISGCSVRIVRHTRCSSDGFDVLVSSTESNNVWDTVLGVCEKLKIGAMPIGKTAFETARIERGIPKEPEDITPENILNETGLESAVSYTKGCYLGQEIVARIHWRGQPARRLCGLTLDVPDQASLPLPGTTLFTDEDRKAGHLTSVTQSFGLNRPIALGYVHKYHIASGTRLKIKAGDQIAGEAEVVTLPFISQ